MSVNYITQITDTSGTTHDIAEGVDTRIFRATCSTVAATAAKVATLDDATGFSLTAGVKVAVTFTYGNSATTPTLNVNSSGAKTIAIPSSETAYTTGNGTTYNTWGAYETVLFTYTGTYWINEGSGLSVYKAYSLADSNALPSQSGNSGKYLTTNGSAVSWASVDTLPSQSGNSGKYLTTNGTAASWATVDTLPSQTGNSGKYLTTDGSSASWGSSITTGSVSIDSSPTASSTNLVESGGVYTAINTKANRTTAVNVADTNYDTVMSRGIYAGTTDLTAGSSALTSGVIYIYYE